MKQFEGQWSYRSFQNNPDISLPFNNIRFAAGLLTFESKGRKITGTLKFGSTVMELTGMVSKPSKAVFEFRWTGVKEASKNSDKWVYDYHGYLDKRWENGVNQAVTITGTVIRTIEHDGAPAGEVGTFHLIKQATP